MRIIYCVIISVLVLFYMVSAQQSRNIKVGSTTRSYLLYTPSGLPEHPPLVISMHGLGGSGSFQRSMYGLETLADKEKFIVVYPDGAFKVSGSNGWDIGGSSDVDFISAIIDSMEHSYKTDPDRVFATGFSMGGMMSYKLACTITDKIAAIAPASGYPMSKFGYNDVCTPTGPIPICHFHGTADEVVTYSGLESFIDKFVKNDGCTATPEITNPSSKVKKEHWKSCNGGSEIIVYHFTGMEHAYPNGASQGFSPNDTLWQFFRNHPRGSTVKTGKISAPANMKGSLSVSLSGGILQVSGTGRIHSVNVFNIQGKELLRWKASSGNRFALVFHLGCQTGICIVSVTGEHGTCAVKVPVRDR